MKYIRYLKNNEITYGALVENSVREIKGDIFNKYKITSLEHNIEKLEVLPPVTPSKVIAIGLNYLDHAQEMDMPVPKEPLIFLKPATTVIGDKDTIFLPPTSKKVDYEAELAIIIGKKAKDITVKDSSDYILGYTCANDVTARDLQEKDGQWTRAKSFDTFCPLGPAIVTDINTHSLDIQCILNDTVVQSSNTRQMIFKAEELVSYVSHIMTLYPGDVIITGTPTGIGQIQDGDIVEIKIDQIGTLQNFVEKL